MPIHPSSIVDPDARLAPDVEVGPWCQIEAGVELGPGCRLISRVHLQGPLRAGSGNVFYPGVCIGFPPQDRGYDPAKPGAGTVLGSRNVLRECVTIHRATGDLPTSLGDDGYLMAYCHLGHDSRVGSRVTMANSTQIAGHVTIGDGANFGGHSGVHQFARVGRMAMVGNTIAAVQDVPPFCIVFPNGHVGPLNLVGLRRAGLRDHIKPLKRALAILYTCGHTNKNAVAHILDEVGSDPLCREFAEFVQGTKHSLMPYAHRADHD